MLRDWCSYWIDVWSLLSFAHVTWMTSSRMSDGDTLGSKSSKLESRDLGVQMRGSRVWSPLPMTLSVSLHIPPPTITHWNLLRSKQSSSGSYQTQLEPGAREEHDCLPSISFATSLELYPLWFSFIHLSSTSYSFASGTSCFDFLEGGIPVLEARSDVIVRSLVPLRAYRRIVW